MFPEYNTAGQFTAHIMLVTQKGNCSLEPSVTNIPILRFYFTMEIRLAQTDREDARTQACLISAGRMELASISEESICRCLPVTSLHYLIVYSSALKVVAMEGCVYAGFHSDQ